MERKERRQYHKDTRVLNIKERWMGAVCDLQGEAAAVRVRAMLKINGVGGAAVVGDW
jgi:hypothetical protein